MFAHRSALALVALFACAQTETPPSPSPAARVPLGSAPSSKSSSSETERRATKALNFKRFTTGGANPSAALPWTIALHGLGDRPESFAHLFDCFPQASHVIVLEAPLARGRGFDWFGHRVSGDPKLLAAGIRKALKLVVAAIDQRRTDRSLVGKPVVTGFSQGGILSFALAALHPSRIAASLPIGGWLPPSLLPTTPTAEPVSIFVFHGEADRTVPWPPTQIVIQQLRDLRFTVEPHSYAGLGHTLNSTLRHEWTQALTQALERSRDSIRN